MPQYVKTVWVNGTVPALNDSNLNKMEQGIFDAFRQDGSTTMSGQLVTTAGSATTPAIAPTGDSNTGIFFPAADTIAFGEGGTEAMRINSSGQVGIGTTTPTALTSMHGSPQATSGAILTLRDTTATGANTTYGAITFLSSPGTDFSIGKASENANSALAFRNANTGAEFMRITSTGNVGIGTTSPTSELHVYSAGSSADIMVETNTTGGDSKIALKCNGTGGRHWYLQTGDNTSTLNGRFRLFDSTAGAERLTIDSTGNVGIGTSSIPSVFGTTVKVAGSSGGTVEISATNVNLRQFASDGLSLAGVGTSTNHPLQLFTNDTERMRITSDGNVGIGVNPNVELHVKGTGEIFRLETTAATGDNFIRFYAPSATTQGYIGYTASANNTMNINQVLNNDLLLHTNNTERMRITSTGNVGIGTTNPQNKLEVSTSTGGVVGIATSGATAGDMYGRLAFYSTAASNAYINYGGEIRSYIGAGINESDLRFYTSDSLATSSERLRISKTGNVGIGTTSPSNYSGRASVGVNGTDGGIFECMVGGTVKFQIYPESSVITDSIVLNAAGANGYMRFQTYNSEKMRLNNNGYLLIGYTSSNGAYPLQVNGQIFATSSTIATSDGRYKKDVVALDGALDIVKALNPVQFNWKEHPVHKFNTDVPTVGFIAQEVAEVLKDKAYLTSLIKKSECTWETETGETVEREVTRDVEKQVTREVEREVTETIDGEEVTRTITEEVTETIIEQVTEIVTEPVKETHTEEFLGIAESNLIAILTKAVKELAQEVESLKAQLNGN